MSEGLLTILKFCLVAAVYLFLVRVVWVVSSEMKGTPMVTVSSASAPTDRRVRKPWTVVAIEPADAGEAWEIHGELTIGRAGGCAVSVPDDTFVSQVHARIFSKGDKLFAEDLGSTNGTLLNGTALSETTELRKGDRVQVGSTVLEATR